MSDEARRRRRRVRTNRDRTAGDGSEIPPTTDVPAATATGADGVGDGDADVPAAKAAGANGDADADVPAAGVSGTSAIADDVDTGTSAGADEDRFSGGADEAADSQRRRGKPAAKESADGKNAKYGKQSKSGTSARSEGGGRNGDAAGGLRGLVGAGPTQLSTGAAMRARDASRPTDEDIAAAEAELVIVRRHWTPPS